jgi:hypothetical protein
LLSLYIDCKATERINEDLLVGDDGLALPTTETYLKLGKLQFMDLASTGKVAENKYNAEQLSDALYINKSISALSKEKTIV